MSQFGPSYSLMLWLVPMNKAAWYFVILYGFYKRIPIIKSVHVSVTKDHKHQCKVARNQESLANCPWFAKLKPAKF